ncbi:MAG TPA: APC family permease [Aliidongia sp.]|uniref:APC family permease n=1 Tax=Aliidongia sp. TaxID=1914230 RepID=UPI002DDCD092|nr:APC family permease [Aliidongia sp.]HEV2673089.1 APC family permease [Aliidongia sp.]
MSLSHVLFGRRLANREAKGTKIGAVAGLAAMGLDGLSSVAYGPEATLTVLMPLGALALGPLVPITGAVLAVLIVLYFSYRQTIAAYPKGGGSYTVAQANIGPGAGLLAATALMLDYVLNVAVGISAGIAALVSAAPALQPLTLPLCLAVLAILTLVNLRGTREAGLIFAVPTYLFIGTLLVVVAIGTAKALAAGGHPVAVVAPPAIPAGTATLGLWLLLRAFASGCTAMTGVEAVSNGMSAFKEPTERHARRTLTAIVGLLTVLLAGVVVLSRIYRIGAMDQTDPGYQTMLSQLTAAVVGHGVFYYATLGTILVVLSLSANTSFTGFPRLCQMIAVDGYLPRAFAIPGRRLVYSAGILFLTGSAGILLVAFDGITDRLIPLFAVGAFLAFTLSQTGMALHWRQALHDPKVSGSRGSLRASLAVNGVGAIATGAALAIILAAKFVEGAWITVIIIPLVFLLLSGIKRYYDRLSSRLRAGRIDFTDREPPIVLIPIERWDRLVDKALKFALQLSPDVIAIHLIALEGDDVEDRSAILRRRWADAVEAPLKQLGVPVPSLVQLQSPYRQLAEPLIAFIRETEQAHPKRAIAMLLPVLVTQHWWERLLHPNRTTMLQKTVLKVCDRRVGIIIVPWHLDDQSADPDRSGARPSNPARRLHDTITH